MILQKGLTKRACQTQMSDGNGSGARDLEMSRSRDLEIYQIYILVFIYFVDIINEYYEYYYEYYELLYVIFIIFVQGPPTLSGKIHWNRQKNAKLTILENALSCILSTQLGLKGRYLMDFKA